MLRDPLSRNGTETDSIIKRAIEAELSTIVLFHKSRDYSLITLILEIPISTQVSNSMLESFDNVRKSPAGCAGLACRWVLKRGEKMDYLCPAEPCILIIPLSNLSQGHVGYCWCCQKPAREAKTPWFDPKPYLPQSTLVRSWIMMRQSTIQAFETQRFGHDIGMN
jgi:hypothetical protein